MQTFANQAAAALENARLYQLEQEEFLRFQQTQVTAIQSEKMEALGRLASALARAIEKPLQTMRQLLQHALESTSAQDQLTSELHQVGREIDRLEQITRSVLSFTQPEAEARVEAAVNDLIQQALAQAEFPSDAVSHSTDHRPSDHAADLRRAATSDPGVFLSD